MKITLMYNPKAGSGELPLDNLMVTLENTGAKVTPQSTKSDDYVKTLDQDCDFILIAGGDGTVGKVIKQIIHKPVPVAILPFGNANNIAKSLNVKTAVDAIIQSWEKKDFSKFRIGSVTTGQETKYFLESVGWGLFAETLSEIKANKIQEGPGEAVMDKIELGLTNLTKSVKKVQPSYFEIYLDGADHSGHYLWVELMNTQKMGPQLLIAPQADHSDKLLDVVLVREGEREKLDRFLREKDHGDKVGNFTTLQARKIKMSCSGPTHIDGKIHEASPLYQKKPEFQEVSLLNQPFLIINA